MNNKLIIYIIIYIKYSYRSTETHAHMYALDSAPTLPIAIYTYLHNLMRPTQYLDHSTNEAVGTTIQKLSIY